MRLTVTEPQIMKAIAMPDGLEWIVILIILAVWLIILSGIFYAVFLCIKFLRLKIKEMENKQDGE